MFVVCSCSAAMSSLRGYVRQHGIYGCVCLWAYAFYRRDSRRLLIGCRPYGGGLCRSSHVIPAGACAMAGIYGCVHPSRSLLQALKISKKKLRHNAFGTTFLLEIPLGMQFVVLVTSGGLWRLQSVSSSCRRLKQLTAPPFPQGTSPTLANHHNKIGHPQPRAAVSVLYSSRAYGLFRSRRENQSPFAR